MSTKLTDKEIYRLGLAAASFSCNEIDQGIHCVLPVTNADGTPENWVFEDLFSHFFGRIPPSTELPSGTFGGVVLPDDVGLIYMGAIAAWTGAIGLEIDNPWTE